VTKRCGKTGHGKNKHLGRYKLKPSAVKARSDAEKTFFGEFAYNGEIK